MPAPPQLRLPHLSFFSKGARSAADSYGSFLLLLEGTDPLAPAGSLRTRATRIDSMLPIDFGIVCMFLRSFGGRQATGLIFISAMTNSFTSTGPFSPRR